MAKLLQNFCTHTHKLSDCTRASINSYQTICNLTNNFKWFLIFLIHANFYKKFPLVVSQHSLKALTWRRWCRRKGEKIKIVSNQYWLRFMIIALAANSRHHKSETMFHILSRTEWVRTGWRSEWVSVWKKVQIHWPQFILAAFLRISECREETHRRRLKLGFFLLITRRTNACSAVWIGEHERYFCVLSFMAKK